MSRRTRRDADVIVYGPFAGPLYGGSGQAGGAELQSFYIARSLAVAGLRVRQVVFGAGVTRSAEGVEVVPLPPEYAGRGLARRRAIVHALRQANGCVYIQRSAGMETGVVGLFARATRGRFIFSASSDGDFIGDRKRVSLAGTAIEEWPTWVQYRLGLRCVHAAVAQTKQQAELARPSLHVDPHVIPSFCPPVGSNPGERNVFLWVGNFAAVKDPLAFLEVAERLPEIRFWMVATTHPTRWKSLAAAVREGAARLPNLDLLSPRPRDELLKLYGRAIAVVSTSHFEGLPNVFLEAWARGVPALSLRVDPDGVISRHGLGVAANGSAELLAQAIRNYAADSAAARAAGEAAYRHVEKHHAPEVVGPQWVSLVEGLLGRC
jgi:glycosyltransferase involved in cell wall biosynthesis